MCNQSCIVQVEGSTIKKPVSHMRRVSTNPMSCNNTHVTGKDTTHVTNRGDSNDTTSVVSKSMQRVTSIYSNRNVSTKKSSNICSNLSNNSSVTLSQKKTSRNEAVRTPVRIKMQNTMSRLNSEVNNTPNKPNAFNLPKCSAHSSIGNSEHKPHTRSQSKYNRNVYSVRLSASEDTKVSGGSTSNGHIVSSPQAKAASTMGIMNFGSAYSSVVAAANRGCLNTKIAQPHPPPLRVVPKTFPISGIAGGEVIAGGSTLSHPPPAHGLVALSPQNIGLGLPFHKYYNSEQQQGKSRRGGTYVVQDPRYGIDYSRISGIYEWVCKQQSETGLSICSYYQPCDVTNCFTNSVSTDNTIISLPDMTSANNCDVIGEKPVNLNKTDHDWGDNALQQSRELFDPVSGELRNLFPYADSCPFANRHTINLHNNPLSKKQPRWEKLAMYQTRAGRRSRTTETFRGRAKQAPKPLPVLKLFSLSHRHKRNGLAAYGNGNLTVSCPSNN